MTPWRRGLPAWRAPTSASRRFTSTTSGRPWSGSATAWRPATTPARWPTAATATPCACRAWCVTTSERFPRSVSIPSPRPERRGFSVLNQADIRIFMQRIQESRPTRAGFYMLLSGLAVSNVERRSEEVASADQPVDVITYVVQGGVSTVKVSIGVVQLQEGLEVAGDVVVGSGRPGITRGVLLFLIDVVVVEVEEPLVDGIAHTDTPGLVTALVTHCEVFVLALVLVAQTTGEAGDELVGGSGTVEQLVVAAALDDVVDNTQRQAQVVDLVLQGTLTGNGSAFARLIFTTFAVVLGLQTNAEAFQVRGHVGHGVAAGLERVALELETLVDVDIERQGDELVVHGVEVTGLDGTPGVAAQAQVALTSLMESVETVVATVCLEAPLQTTEGGQVGGHFVAKVQTKAGVGVDKIGVIVDCVAIGIGFGATTGDTHGDATIDIHLGAVLIVDGGRLGAGGDHGTSNSSR